MSPSEPPTEEDGGWKTRYLDSLDELERREAEYQEVEELLRRALGRLALAGMDLDTGLDPHLEALRQSLRSHGDPHQIAALCGRIADHATSIKEDPAATGASSGEVLAALLEGLPLPRAKAREARSLSLELRNHGAGEDAVQRLSGFLGGLLAGPSPPPPSRLKGLLGRLGAPSDAPPPTPGDDPVVTTVGDELARMMARLDTTGGPREDARALTRRLASARRLTELKPLLKDLGRLLQAWQTELGQTHPPAADDTAIASALAALVERFDLPEALAERRESILRELRHRPAHASLATVLGDVADLVAAMRQDLLRQSTELEQFLFGVNHRLRQIEEHIGDADVTRMDSEDSGQTLEKQMRERVATMRHSLAAAASLDQVKGAIVKGLELVEHHLDDHQAREAELQRRAARHIASLREQVQVLEGEGSHLRQRLEEEHRKTLTDALTGIYNRQAYDEHMARSYAHWKRYGGHLGVIMIDIDRFKTLNDAFGHPAGDKVLKAVAGHLQKQVRESDVLARYGGEEFAVILPETDCRDALGVAEKLRARVEGYGFRHKGEPVRVTVSCGITAFRPGDTPQTTLERADALLYRAKGEGRNRCLADCPEGVG